jgi:hypothetical protein
MSPCPEHFIASGAALELGLRHVNIRRNGLAHCFPTCFGQCLVTAKTTGEDGRTPTRSGHTQNLFQLVLKILGFNEYKVPDRFSNQKPRITRKQDPLFIVRDFYQRVIRNLVGVEDIKASNPEPLGQSPEHDIHNKPRWLSLFKQA